MEGLPVEHIITFFLLLITIAYAVFTLTMCIAWLRIKTFPAQSNKQYTIPVSVIIAVRNEENGILELLQDLNQQNYPHQFLEVIIIDDHSTDATVSLVTGYIPEATYTLRLHKLGDDLSEALPQNNYKKKAIELAVGLSTGTLIVTTDGDCRVEERWISTIVQAYLASDVKIISSAVTFYREKSLFEKLQTIEFASLIGSGAATLSLGSPTMCNGANMAYAKEAFLHVGGYADNAGTVSGDDIFLMHKINQAFPGKACFLKHKDAIVYTRPKENWNAFLQQRKRWAGKWNMYHDKRVVLLAVFIFFSNFSLFLALLFLLSGYYPVSMFLIQIAIKFSVEFVFLSFVLSYLNKRRFIVFIILLQLVYFLYVSFFGLISQKKGYNWKGRNVQ